VNKGNKFCSDNAAGNIILRQLLKESVNGALLHLLQIQRFTVIEILHVLLLGIQPSSVNWFSWNILLFCFYCNLVMRVIYGPLVFQEVGVSFDNDKSMRDGVNYIVSTLEETQSLEKQLIK
jgi:hypothetical protein